MAREYVGGEVLHEIDLIDVAPGDCLPDAHDRLGVVIRAPGLQPGAERERLVQKIVIFDNILFRPDGTGCQRERARLGWRRGMPTAKRGREAVAEIEIGDETLATGHEEATVAQPGLDPLERPGGVVDLDRGVAGHTLSFMPRVIGAGRPICLELRETAFATLSSV